MQSQVKVVLDGASLTPDALYTLGYEPLATIDLAANAVARIKAGRAVIDKIVEDRQTVYGINTGFGKFESTIISPDQLELLQLNLVRSHSACVGEPLTPQRARMMMALRVNILCKGHSGIRLETVQKYVQAFNAGVVPYIPEQGTVGASGDLGPLSHLALGMLGEGRLATLKNLKFRDARVVLQELGVEPITLKAKEGLALINGTQFISALGSEAVVRARRVARLADVVLAMTSEALLSTVSNLNPDIHRVRPHKGQQIVALRLRSLLHSEKFPSAICLSHANCGRVQDAYSIRCAPQVHGISNDIVEWVYGVLTTELNCATDNPLVFPDGVKKVVSCGNFHGEYPAKALDMLAIGVHELGNISERRIERLNNPSLSRLPAFLVKNGGLNSGFMIAHCTAAALVSENKVYCHPASIDSISTSAAQEDHVSMGGFSARKAIKVVENVEHILAIELLCACQGVDLLRPLRSTEPMEKVWSLVRGVSPSWDKDREMHSSITNVVKLLRSGAIWNVVKKYVPEEARFLDVFTVKKPFGLQSKM
ncbi:putative histidine ammonia-lyase [Trypanosoma conorhini]|uniref:Histidine ammonia-lyase n=1 Tax=Trypanosoma conorhini TaxID=83891 RepID=A0A3R7LG11_9TRYP|nr:putative histidine ammonia-lyase [Trypanosoma conorhini]RNF13668.1 putative histidine ammonia-lyase [Trypanosoma conorhini]